MPPHTVASLLAQQPEETLAEMLESINGEIARLNREIARQKVEAQLVEQALLKHRPKRAGGGGADGRRSVKQSEVIELVKGLPQPFAPRDVRQRFQESGTEISGAAVRNHLRRLVREMILESPEEGVYAVRTADQEPPVPAATPTSVAVERPSLPSNDDIPF
jgi:hypothetical protein